MNFWFTYTPLLFALGAMAACSSHPPYNGPPIQLMEVERADPGDDETQAPSSAEEAETDLGELPPLRSIASHLESQRITDQTVAQPQDAERVRSVINYRYHPGTVYQVDTQPGFLTALVLEPGERVIARASGDTERWLVEETAVGSGPH
ncbi:MAG: TrbG/VirB9 family P-type conjugative transfer protein, partial [Planctomycetota bacterium]